MAQDYGGTHLAETWAQINAQPTALVEVQWDGTNWIDETERVWAIESIRTALYTSGGLSRLGTAPPGVARLSLKNDDHRFSPDNAGSPIHTYIANGIYRVPIRISIGYVYQGTPERLRQFTGQIDGASERWGSIRKNVRFSAMDTIIVVRQHKHSSALYSGYRADQLIGTYLDVPDDPAVSHSQDYAHSIIPYGGMDKENIWSECQDVAAADGGWVYCKKDGTIVFERMTHWLEGTDHTASQATLDTGAGGNAEWLEDSIDWRDVYSDVTVSWTPRQGTTVEVIWESMEPIELRPGETKTIDAKLDYIVSELIAPVKKNDYFAVTAGMREMNDDLSITVTPYLKAADIELTNGHSDQTMFVLELQLRGYPLMGRETHEISKTHDAAVLPGKKEFLCPQNFYMQTEIQAERRANYLRDLLQRPRRLLRWRGPGCPWLELGDRVRVTDPGAGIDVYGYVLQIDQSFPAGEQWRMGVAVLPVTNLWAESSYFLLGSSQYKDSGADPLFY